MILKSYHSRNITSNLFLPKIPCISTFVLDQQIFARILSKGISRNSNQSKRLFLKGTEQTTFRLNCAITYWQYVNQYINLLHEHHFQHYMPISNLITYSKIFFGLHGWIDVVIHFIKQMKVFLKDLKVCTISQVPKSFL